MNLSLTFNLLQNRKQVSVYQSILNFCYPSTGPQTDLGDDARGYLCINSERVVTESQSPCMFLEAFEILKDSH